MSKPDFFDSLLPDFSAFERTFTFPTKTSLIDAFKAYDKEIVLKSKAERLRKSSNKIESVDHKIFTLFAMAKCKLSNKFRFVVNSNGQILFGIEKTAGVDIPGHYRISLVTPETKKIPEEYDNPESGVALSAGRVFLKKNKIYAIDHNSSAFEPHASVLLKGLAIIFVANPAILSEKIEIRILDKRGKSENSHKFTLDELKSLINEKFNEEEQKIMKEKNNTRKIIHLQRERGIIPIDDSDEDSAKLPHATHPRALGDLFRFFGAPEKDKSSSTTLKTLTFDDQVFISPPKRKREADEEKGKSKGKGKENRRLVSRSLLRSSSNTSLPAPKR